MTILGRPQRVCWLPFYFKKQICFPYSLLCLLASSSTLSSPCVRVCLRQGYGEALEALGRFKAAADAYGKAATARPDDPARHAATGHALLRLLALAAEAPDGQSAQTKSLSGEEKEFM